MVWIVDNVPVSNLWNPLKIIVHFIWLYQILKKALQRIPSSGKIYVRIP